jgi:hypothetical protein
LFYSPNRALVLFGVLIASMASASSKNFVQIPQPAESLMAQISSMPRPEEVGLPLVGAIKGVVVDPDGKPVAGAVVHETDVGDERPLGGRIFRTSTTTDAQGDFVLDQVVPAETVQVWAYKFADYYEDLMEPFTFNRPKNLKFPIVQVKPEQTVTGVRIQFAQKAGKLHWQVRDAETKELVHGVFIRWCRQNVPAKYCMNGSAPSDYEQIISAGVGIAIQIAADDGLHKKWNYRNSKTGSRYFWAAPGRTDSVTVFLSKQ